MNTTVTRCAGAALAVSLLVSLSSCATPTAEAMPPDAPIETVEPEATTTAPVPEPSVTADPEPAVSQEPSETPAPAPEPEPGDDTAPEPPREPAAPDPMDPTTWTITPNGIGPALLGMPIADVAAVTGIPVVVDDRGGYTDESKRCSGVTGSDPAWFHVASQDGIVRSVSIQSDVSSDLAGVGTVTDTQDAMDLMGEPTYASWGPGGSPAWIIADNDSAVIAAGSQYSNDDPVRFHVTDFSYTPSGGGESVWFPVCYD